MEKEAKLLSEKIRVFKSTIRWRMVSTHAHAHVSTHQTTVFGLKKGQWILILQHTFESLCWKEYESFVVSQSPLSLFFVDLLYSVISLFIHNFASNLFSTNTRAMERGERERKKLKDIWNVQQQQQQQRCHHHFLSGRGTGLYCWELLNSYPLWWRSYSARRRARGREREGESGRQEE